MWPFKKEKRNNEQPQPYVEKPTDACTEMNQGIGLLQKMLSLKGYDAMSQSAFFCAVNLISNSLASMHWDLKAYDDTEIPKDLNYDHLFDNMNVGRFLTVKNMIMDVILHGNGFCYIHRDKRGEPIGLEYLPFGQCSIMYNKASDTLFYQAPMVSKSLIEPINILHFKMLSYNGIEGKSLLIYAKNAINLSGSADKAASEFFSNGMNVHGILSTDTPRLTKDQRESIRSAWNESQIGNGTGIAVLESGMKFNPISSNSKDAQLLETRLFNVQEVARFFQIAPTLLGDLSKTSYNTLEQAQLAFILNTLAPYVAMIEEELNRKLIMPNVKFRYYIDVCEEDIVRSDKQSQVNYLTTLCEKGILTVNEVREQLGFQPVDGGDELHALYTDTEQNKINQDKNTQENNDEEES